MNPTHVNLGQWYQPAVMRTSVDGAVVAPVTVFWNMSKK
jgi:peptide/nickel transport system substrate-binding protein